MAEKKKIRVLLAENDAFLSNIYKTKFEMEGFEFFTVSDGSTVETAIKKKRPQIILLDVLLPQKDGFTILKELKDSKEFKDIPVILLTNLGQKEDVKKGMELGAADYLIKAHFKPAEIVDKVKKMIEKQRK